MKCGKCGLMLMLLAMGACSGGGPTTPPDEDVIATDRPEVEAVSVTYGTMPAGKSLPSDATLQLDDRRSGTPDLTKTMLTWKSAYAVDRAARDFARDNDGWFPVGLSDRNAAGLNLIDYLPIGRLLVNAFTGARTEPTVGVAAWQGQVGYLAVHDQDGYPVGYVVSAVGINHEEVLHIENLPD